MNHSRMGEGSSSVATSWGGEGGGGAGPSVAPEQLVEGGGAERQQFHEGLDPGRRGKSPSSSPLSPQALPKMGLGRSCQQGDLCLLCLQGTLKGLDTFLGTKDVFSFPGTLQFSTSPFLTPGCHHTLGFLKCTKNMNLVTFSDKVKL